jgi:sugar phosphate isomerase/epimerase
MTDRRIAVSEITTAEWGFERDVEAYGETEGVEGIGVWRDNLAEFDGDADDAAALIEAAGLEACSLIFAGGFTDDFDASVADAEAAIADAATLGAPVLMLLAGPRLGVDAAEGDRLVREAIEELAPTAREAGIELALEPLHPVDATRYSSVVTLSQALDVVEGIEGAGIMYDTWNTWWDPEVEAGIERAGERGNIAAVHVADWRHPSDEPRDRAVPGEGVAPLTDLLGAVEAAGYGGWYEVELFTERYAPDEYPDLLERCVDGTREVLP